MLHNPPSLGDLARDIGQWSQRTFGLDTERGPVGPLKHLAKEALEAAACFDDPWEYADCLILILDASRRAGITPNELIQHAQQKMEINKRRIWPKPVADQPCEHIKWLRDGDANERKVD